MRNSSAELNRGVVTILATGVALGLAFNWIGLHSRAAWGLAWVGEDALARLNTMPRVEAVAGETDTGAGPVSDDPLAIPAGASTVAALPEIPDVGRPVQIELAALKQYVDAGAAVLVDAREPEEYRAGHIPGALSLPYDEVITDPLRLESLATAGRPIITYCGGGTCELSLSLADELYFAGHRRVAVYIGGYPQWVEAGYPVEAGAAEERVAP